MIPQQSIFDYLDQLHARNSDTAARVPSLLLANLPAYQAKGRSTTAKAGGEPSFPGGPTPLPVPPSITSNTGYNGFDAPGAAPQFAAGGVDALNAGQVPQSLMASGGNPQVQIPTFSGAPNEIYTPPANVAGGDNSDVGGGPNYGGAGSGSFLPGGSMNLPSQGQIDAAGAASGGYPVPGVDPKNLGPVQASKPFPWSPVLGTVGGVAGAVLGGPVGGLAGRLGGTLLGKILQNGGFDNANRYDPTKPVSLSNIPPATAGQTSFPLPGGGGNVAYQQSGSIMDASRPGALRGVDPNTVLFTNSIQPFGPGRPARPGMAGNDSSGYLGSGIAQGDAMQQAQLYARMVEGGGADRVLNDTLPPGFPTGLLNDQGPMPMFAPAPLPAWLTAPPPSLNGDVISNSLPPKG